MEEADFDRVVEEGRALQERFPALGLVAVGGTAAALHCAHRFSLDVDSVTPRLKVEMNNGLPSVLDHGFYESTQP